MLSGIIPKGIFWKIAEDWMWETPVCSAEEALIEKAVDKRKREFRAGRNCAHALFKEHSIRCNALLKGVQREPAWPEGWVGSISHTKGLCAVAIAPNNLYRSLGLDVEQDTPLSADILNMICGPTEQDQFTQLSFSAGQNIASYPLDKVTFSAKESIHKAYFPLNHHTLDFLDARITLDAREPTFKASILSPEPNPKVPIDSLTGRYCVDKGYIATFIALAV